ncbi:MAG: hypothetical protein MUE72_10050 [Chitinophagaceae bacterium]|jgi:hypothetical protein|nr:hypothetical protein [Chitinophagaceae bacterium]
MIKNISATRLLFSVFAMTMILFLTACAKKIAFQSSSVVPAARGVTTVKKDKNNNYNINMKLQYLAEPSRLNPPKSVYVVWVLTDNNVTQNIGQIKTSNHLNVTFETVTSFKPIKIYITAEDDASVRNPGMTLVLTTDNF